MKDNREGGNFFDLIEEKLEKWGMPGGEAGEVRYEKKLRAFSSYTIEKAEIEARNVELLKQIMEENAKRDAENAQHNLVSGSSRVYTRNIGAGLLQ
uniref:Uncharacterized protein n=1 Tax=Rhizophagus irregularis (strain DAOM 181602 / DAOM 197198 / MUCL 43194) TaxID=747089 RepID=U9SP24_RHIID